MKSEEIEKLAELSKIEISEEEKSSFSNEIGDILEYVKDVEKVSGENIPKEAGDLRNVLREDADPHEQEKFTESILENAPETKDDYIKVKKIL